MESKHKHVDWAQRYRDEVTPWDRGRAHAELQARIDSGQLKPLHEGATCFIPGCGRGHDALALARAGWKVTAMDVVDQLAGPLKAALEPLGGKFLVGDALHPALGEFDFVWEHTFLCAIRPGERAAWATMVRDSVRSGGQFGALIFPANKTVEDGGPPWGYNVQKLAGWIGEGFELVDTAAIDPELEPRAWDQAFALFHRT